MNYLGHLILTDNNSGLKLANLYGDFFKGSRFEGVPELVVQGVRLHRSIDSFIDHHPVTKSLLKRLYSPLPRVSSIALDLFFDHLLAIHWGSYCSSSLNEFSEDFFEYALVPSNHNFESFNFSYKPDFLDLLRYMEKGQWLLGYREMSGLEFACKGLSRRISFSNNLDQAPNVFIQHRDMIEEVFFDFMEDAMAYFKPNHYEASGQSF